VQALYAVNERVKVIANYVGVDFTVHINSEPLVLAVYLKRGADWKPVSLYSDFLFDDLECLWRVPFLAGSVGLYLGVARWIAR
jgi:hypothetical protein